MGHLHPCPYPPLWCCASCPRLALPPPSGIFTTPTPRTMGGKVDYLLHLQPSSLTMKTFGIHAPTLRLTAGLGESRHPSSMWIVFLTTSYPRGLTSWTPPPILLWGTHSVCHLWRSTFLLHRRLQSPTLILSPSLPLFMGGLGGAFARSDQRFSSLSMPLREICIVRGGVLNSIPSLKDTPHHALAASSHRRLNMGGALVPVAASILCPSLPLWGMGGDMTAAVVRPHHILNVHLTALPRGPLPFLRRIHPLLVLRSSTGEDLIPRTLTQRAARIRRSGAAAHPPTQLSTLLLRLGEPRLPPAPCLVLRPIRALSPFPLWRPSLSPRSRTPPTTFKRAISSFTGSVAQATLLHAPTQPLLRTRGTPLPASSGRARSGLL